MFFKAPYFGKPSHKFQSRVGRELLKYGLQTQAVYSTLKVSSYFSLKTKVSHLFNSNLVYKFTGSCDKDISYIGETRRQLCRRIQDHREGKSSAIFEHLQSCQTCQNCGNFTDSFTVLQKCSSYNVLSVESLLIAKNRPSLNTQMGPSKGTISLTLYS